ncbi:dynein heavy chain 2, axonemal-like [Cephus cinctus]|uniref:Dynein heavy chain 2, axonemal-like n=1 Tax=Cephus cinctus TaxID=211228 RepID=A0AAJ7W179_CEPCN|nr:dynein heavy chain 2, axonemal-like [Cephus cinctus]XP_024940641.1 dynein heavy chain 2, axonemal-like [Cephus cinctus]
MQRRKDKVKDNPAVDPHREYLDAESSDEGGDRRTEFQEDEELTESLKSLYDAEELEKLVGYVKDMTILFALDDSHWTEEVLSEIREFFYDSTVRVLSIYFDNYTLAAELDFPSVPVHELTYFIKEPYEVLTAENFHQNVMFGTINGDVEASILNAVGNLWAPTFFNVNTWPDSILLNDDNNSL